MPRSAYYNSPSWPGRAPSPDPSPRWIVVYGLRESEREAVKQYVTRQGWTWRAHGEAGAVLALDVPRHYRAKVGAAIAATFPHAHTVHPTPDELVKVDRAGDWDYLRAEIRNLPLDWSHYDPKWEEDRTRLDD